MAKAPEGAMSSPYNQGGEFSDMLKKTTYFKDASFNTEQKVGDLSPEKQAEIHNECLAAQAKAEAVPAPARKFTPEKKNELVKLFMGQNANLVSVTDEKIIVELNGSSIELLPG
jgi:hypothetical protein